MTFSCCRQYRFVLFFFTISNSSDWLPISPLTSDHSFLAERLELMNSIPAGTWLFDQLVTSSLHRSVRRECVVS